MRVNRGTGEVSHHCMPEIASLLSKDTLIVFNDSKVRKARLSAQSETGGIVEFLLVERLAPGRWNVIVSRAKRQRPGRTYLFPGDIRGSVIGKAEPYHVVEFSEDIGDGYLETHGHIPLPPYIRREDTQSDADRYQTVYSKTVGSVAAPTAGLHFTKHLIEQIEAAGVDVAWVTLHVGIGTFLPIRTETVEAHTMHEERYEISEPTADKVNRALEEGRPIVAVGTTTVRTLESAARTNRRLESGSAATDLFIYPGYEFRVISGMFTNFHTPESSLLVMVSAFAGVESIRAAYEQAIAEEYRLFSYGDAMLIL